MVDKSVKMKVDASAMSNDVQAYVIVSVDKNGQCNLQADGTAFEVSFMTKVLESFTYKLINGEIKAR